MLLSNQRRQNKKMGIDEFSLPVPPLDDDPFATLSAADIAAMEAAPTPMKLLALNTRMTMSDPLLRLKLLFPFWCLDAKGEQNVFI
jgi:hypothetical protein